MTTEHKPHQVPFNVAVARELTTFENEPTLEQALKWRLNEACDEIERLIEQHERMVQQVAHVQTLRVSEGEQAEHRVRELEEQLGAQRSVLEKIVREADSSLEVLPPTNTDTAYFDGRREAALEALAASNPAKERP